MALIKNKMTDLGVEANYWKVTMISIDRFMKTGSFSLSLFMTRGAKQFIETYTVPMLESEEAYIECFESGEYKDVFTGCYEYAKKYIEFFKDAVDDEEELLYKESLRNTKH